MAGEGLPGAGETASLRRANELGHRGEVMENGQHRQGVGWETGVGAHFSGVGSFRGRLEEGMVQGTHEAWRAHPSGGLCKGAQAAHPQAVSVGRTRSQSGAGDTWRCGTQRQLALRSPVTTTTLAGVNRR